MNESDGQSASHYVTCHCESCGGGIQFPDEGLGEEIQCPHCGKMIVLKRQFPRYALPAFAVIALLVIGAAVVLLTFQSKHKAHANQSAGQMGKTLLPVETVSEPTNPLTTLIEKAKSGDATAQDNLGLLYLQGGHGIRKDESEAVKWFRQSAEKGDALAQNHLGYCYAGGNGVTQSYEEAERWWHKAANQGNPDAQFNLGQDAYFGFGVEKNVQEAVKWYRAAAEHGYARAQYNLGVCYEKGIAVAANEVEAVKWYKLAAEQGDALSQYALATKYDAGQGITQDLIEAYKWYSLAFANGLNQSQMAGNNDVAKEATQAFNELKSRMDATQIEEARRRVRAFVPQNPSVVAPSESSEPVLFVDPSGSFEMRINRILIGQRAVDESVIYQYQLDDLRSRNKVVVYFDISLKNINGPQERDLFLSDFSLQDKEGNTYSSEMTSDYIHGSVLRGKTGRGGIAFAVERGSIPTTFPNPGLQEFASLKVTADKWRVTRIRLSIPVNS